MTVQRAVHLLEPDEVAEDMAGFEDTVSQQSIPLSSLPRKKGTAHLVKSQGYECIAGGRPSHAAAHEQRCEAVPHENVHHVESADARPRQYQSQVSITKRRYNSSSFPDNKRIRSPEKTSTRPIHGDQLSVSSGVYPRQEHDDALQVQADGRLLDEETSHLSELSHSRDEATAGGDFALPGDIPRSVILRRAYPVDRRFATSPRSLVRMFANVKELTSQMREEAILTDHWRLLRTSSAAHFRPPNHFNIGRPPHGQLMAGNTHTSPATESHQPCCFPGTWLEYSSGAYLRSHGCISSRTRASHNSGRGTANSNESGIMENEVGFIGGHKLMNRPAQRDSESDSDKDRPRHGMNLPESRFDGLARTGGGSEEDTQEEEPRAAAVHSDATYQAEFGAPEHWQNRASGGDEPLPGSLADGGGESTAGDSPNKGNMGVERSGSEQSGMDDSGPGSVGTLESRSLNRNSDSTNNTTEPLTPVDDLVSSVQTGLITTAEPKKDTTAEEMAIF